MQTRLPILLTLLLLLTALPAAAESPTQADPRLPPYTQADADRYLTLYEETYATALASGYRNIFEGTLEEQKAAATSGFTRGFPEPGDITQEQAICLCYYELEHTYGVTEDILKRLYVECSFELRGNDDRIWHIRFNPIKPSEIAETDNYGFTINALTGEIENVSYSGNAVG